VTERNRRRRLVAAGAGALMVVAAAAAGFALKERSSEFPPRGAAERPELLLLTSLPIVFPEGFSLEGSQAPALAALRERYQVIPISTAGQGSLAGRRLLLMAQPNAQPAEYLFEFDQWVRNGGRVLLLADPSLEWPSERPLGDPLRPPLAFADTGLLGHWGLRLDAPDEPGPATFTINGRTAHALSPGTLVATGRHCEVTRDGFVARCRIGRGRAIVVADADFADVERRREPARSGNLDVLLGELARLEQ
jgi:hypothetical protein